MMTPLTNWKILTPSNENLFGDIISSENFEITSDWVNTTIPMSVVGSLYEAKKIEDIYFGKNMFNLNGFKTEAKSHFSWHAMPENSPYKLPTWYRTEFETDDKNTDNRWWIKFHGINFRAEIWINGKRIATETGCAGSYRQYDFDITKWVRRYNKNIVAVKITAQRHDELGLTFVDWSPTPPDDGAGLWQRVELYSTGKIAIKELFVDPVLSGDLKMADVNFSCRLVNNTDEKFVGKLKIMLDEGQFIEFGVNIEKHDEELIVEKGVLFDKNFALWFPHDMGEQRLYSLFVALTDENCREIETANVRYAYRKIESKINEFGAREIWVNKQKVLIRGAAYAPDILLRQDFQKENIETDYIKAMNFNAVRFEGFLGSDNLFNLCDEKGILVLAGWSCCTHWEKWDKWMPEDYHIAEESLKSQLLRLRNHPSLAVWFYGSDFPPVPKVEKIYLAVLSKYAPNLVSVSSAAKFPSAITGESGMKMSGPYGFVPPAYWYDDNMNGAAHSFNAETCPDASLPRYESAIKYLPENERFVGSPSWNFHCGVSCFEDSETTNNGLEKRYGVSRKDFKKFLQVGQIMGYECWRAMYEAYGRNFPDGTGVIGWMLNSSWGKNFWQLYDYYLVPTGGFYGAQKACEQVHCQYSYDDNSIWAVNFSQKTSEFSLDITLYNKTSDVIYEESRKIKLESGQRTKISTVQFDKINEDFFILHLDYKTQTNTYWLSKKRDEFVQEHTRECWYYRPQTKYADFSPILTMPKTSLKTVLKKDGRNAEITVLNTENHFAAAIQLDFMTENGELFYPIKFSENLLWLPPQSVRKINATILENSHISFDNLTLRVEAINS
ncbi:MAG: beta galactosidase jelly roll domain-containing protein [Chitinivibrionia bacterium]|nr:beta galactosidase jelly roll domain-containing protein [Chitinivibrionia bacterium]